MKDVSRTLITGGGGFVGGAVRAAMERAGRTYDAPPRATLDVTTGVPDLSGVDHVVHVAGRTFVPASWEDPTAFFRDNALGTMHLLEGARRAGASVTLVSAYVYGSPQSLPVGEAHPPRPNNPYAFSKLEAERCGAFYAEHLGLDVTALRVFNVYGPGQPGHFLIPHLLSQVLDPACDCVELGATTPRRDFVHLEDVAAAVVTASGRESGWQVFNVGSGESRSVLEVLEAILSAAGVRKPHRSTDEGRRNELSDVVADISAIRGRLGWEPTISFDDGVRRLVGGSATT